MRSEADTAEAPTADQLRWRWLGALAGFVLLMVVLGAAGWLPKPDVRFVLADLGETERLQKSLTSLGIALSVDALLYFALGALTAAIPRIEKRRWRAARMLICGWLLSLPIAYGLRYCEFAQPPESIQLLAPCLACFLGVWTAALWRLGFWARLSLVPQAALLVLGVVALVDASLEAKPLSIPDRQITAEEKRRLVAQLRRNEVRGEAGRYVRALELSQHDAETLINWGLQVVENDGPSRAALQFLDDDTLAGQAALAWPRADGVFLNVMLQGKLRVEDGILHLRLSKLRLGRVAVPGVLLPLAAELMMSSARLEPALQQTITRTQSVRIRPRRVTAVFEKGAITEELLPGLDVRDDDVQQATVVQLRHLTEQLPALNGDAQPLRRFVTQSFALAAARSADGDAVKENRAALYALGILLGHCELSKLVLGNEYRQELRDTACAQNGRVPLRGRRDWTQHFFVSAALAAHSSPWISDTAGILKEQLDAGRGGSGFSFADLAADRAGVRFAATATADEQSALRVQRSICENFGIDDLMPEAADLPEGLSDEQLQQQYGGVGGKRYRALVDEIEARLDACELLQ